MAQANKLQFKFMTEKEFKEGIDKLVMSGKEVNAMIQVMAIQAIAYSLKPNVHDARKAIALVDAFPDGMKKKNLVNFLETKGMLRWSDEKKQLIFFRREDIELTDEYMESLKQKEWHKFGPQDDGITSIWDQEDDVKKFLKKIQNKAKNKEEMKNVMLGMFVEQAYEQFKQYQANELATTNAASEANKAQEGEVTDVASEVEKLEQQKAPLRRTADRKTAMAH